MNSPEHEQLGPGEEMLSNIQSTLVIADFV